MYRNALDPYGLSYEPNLGWDSPEVTSTANALFAAQPSRFPRWELNALAGGEQAKAGLFGKVLGALGLDESGNRAGTSWTDAAKHTASNVINAPQDIANQLLALREYQPVYGTAGDAEDKALAGRQAAETFGLAGLAPVAAAGVTRATRAPGMPQKFEPGWHPDVYYHGTTKDFERFASPEELAKRDPVWRDPSMSHQKHHFTVWPDAASQYAMENGVDGARVIPVRLRSDVPTTQMGVWAATDTPGTVKSAITGETLFSNSDRASLPGLIAEGGTARSEAAAGLPSNALAPNQQLARLMADDPQGHRPSSGPQGQEGRSSMQSDSLSDALSTPLPMDTAARMDRAASLGFYPHHTWYHVTDKDFSAFKNRGIQRNTDPDAIHLARLGTWVSDRPDRVHALAPGDRTMPLLARHGDYSGARPDDLYNAGSLSDLFEMAKKPGFKKQLQADGYKGIRLTDDEFSGRGSAELNKAMNDAVSAYNETVRPINAGGATAEQVDAWRAAKTKMDDLSKQLSQERERERVTSAVFFDPKDLRSKFAAFDPAKAHSANLLAANSDRASLPGITAYHGSPHDFERFSMDKIGTGEGAQAYGHGLYFAENEGVAKQYRDQLGSYDGTVKWRGEQAPTPLQQSILDKLSGADESGAMTVAKLERELAQSARHASASAEAFGNPAMKDIAEQRRAELAELRRVADKIEIAPPGHMYEVRINAAPEDFLDWDKPLSQQGEKVQGALSKFDRDMYHPEGADYDPMEPGHIAYQRLAERLSKPIPADADASWSSVVNTINDKVQNRGGATDFLRDAGIPGIRYLDQGSRGAGEGSRNLVVFDDKIIDIIRKYGWAAAAPLIAAYQSDGAQANALAGR